MNDLIDRQAAIDALDCINGVEEVLRVLPSVQPEITYCLECANRPECPWTRTEEDYCSRAQRRRNNE